MANEKKKIVTEETIKKDFNLTEGGNWLYALCGVIAFVLIIVSLFRNEFENGWYIFCVFFGIIIALGGTIIGVVDHRNYLSDMKDLNNSDYIIKIAKCVSKHEFEDSGDEPGYIYSVTLDCDQRTESVDIPFDLYEKTEVGDLYYVVITNRTKHMIKAYRCDDFKLSESVKKKLIADDKALNE